MLIRDYQLSDAAPIKRLIDAAFLPDEAASNAIGHLMKELNDQGLYTLKEAG